MRGMYPTPAWALREDFIFDKALFMQSLGESLHLILELKVPKEQEV